MKQYILSTAAVMIIGCMAACNNAGETDTTELAEDINDRKLENTLLEDDAEFAVWAADEGLTVVRLSELAAARADNPEVRQLATAIVGDHEQAINELKMLAESKGIVLPVAPGTENQRDYDQLAERTGADFEKEYIDYTVREHKKMVEKYRDEADEAQDPEVRSWINDKIPVLQQHLQKAEATQDALKN